MSTQNRIKVLFNIIFTIDGEPASKANQRKLVLIKGRMVPIKSKKALDYVKEFQKQIPKIDPLTEDYVKVEMMIYYASRRPDLDESLILDCMQNYVYYNDRQVKEKHIYWGLDKERPRTIIRVSEYRKEDTPDYLTN
jgi:Holliday junction resolvase RusA-like endonuclease|tara:strand:- start:291 stop:701 length:411 start_codon:yes stop_codon:yes gene_type:complete